MCNITNCAILKVIRHMQAIPIFPYHSMLQKETFMYKTCTSHVITFPLHTACVYMKMLSIMEGPLSRMVLPRMVLWS